MDQLELDRVLRIVRHYLPKHLDAEDLAIRVIMTSWLHGHERSSRSFIQFKILTAIKKWQTERDRMASYSLANKPPGRPEQTAGPPIETTEVLKIATSVLTSQERKAIWYKYYLELSTEETSGRMHLSISRTSELIRQGLQSMRKELEGNEWAREQVGAFCGGPTPDALRGS